MKKILLTLLMSLICFTSIFSIVGCNSSNSENSNNSTEPTKEQIKLSSTKYTYDTLIDDLILYCCSKTSSGSYYLSSRFSNKTYLAKNSSVENLIDKTLIEKMKAKNIDSDSVYYLAMTFPDSWNKHKKLVVYDDIYKCYYPLFLTYLEEEDNETIENDITRVIKAKLRDPQSFYMDTETHVKYSWFLYVKSYKGDTLYYVNDDGEYSDRVYFYVKYHAKNGFGGYNSSGVWLSYSSEGYVSWTGNTGDGGEYGEYNSGYNLYGDNQNLAHCGGLYVHYGH